MAPRSEPVGLETRDDKERVRKVLNDTTTTARRFAEADEE